MRALVRRMVRAAACGAALACAASGAGCARYITADSRFYAVVATDLEGRVISQWTAAGFVRRVDRNEWQFTAVEKKKFGRDGIELRYRTGRKVRISVPGAAVYRVPAPAWIAEGGGGGVEAGAAAAGR